MASRTITSLFEDRGVPSPPPHAYYPGHPSFPLSSAHPYSSSAYTSASYSSGSPRNDRRASSTSSSPPASFLSSEWIDRPIGTEDRVERAQLNRNSARLDYDISVERIDRLPLEKSEDGAKGGKGSKEGKEQLRVAVQEVVELETEYEVDLLPEEHPQQLPLWRKWLAVVVVSCCSFCVTGSSSMVRLPCVVFFSSKQWSSCNFVAIGSFYRNSGFWRFPYFSWSRCSFSFPIHWGHGSRSFTYGTLVGDVRTEHNLPCFIYFNVCVLVRCGFCSGHRCVLQLSFCRPCAHITSRVAVYLIFRFLSGFVGATFLSVAGGTVSDLFKNEEVAK